jgi:hypothetical protein
VARPVRSSPAAGRDNGFRLSSSPLSKRRRSLSQPGPTPRRPAPGRARGGGSSGDEDDAGGRDRGLRDQGVVAVVGGVDDAHAVDVCLSDAGPSRTTTAGKGRPCLAESRSCSTNWRGAPVRSDDIGGVDHEQAPTFACRASDDTKTHDPQGLSGPRNPLGDHNAD